MEPPPGIIVKGKKTFVGDQKEFLTFFGNAVWSRFSFTSYTELILFSGVHFFEVQITKLTSINLSFGICKEQCKRQRDQFLGSSSGTVSLISVNKCPR